MNLDSLKDALKNVHTEDLVPFIMPAVGGVAGGLGGGQDGGKYFNDSVAGGEKFESPLEYAKAWELQNWKQQRNALTDDQKFQAKFNEITGIDTLPKKYKPVGEPDKVGYIGGRNAADQYNGTLESAQNRERWFNDNFENIARLGDTPQETLATRKAQQQNLGIRAGDDADAFAKSQVAQDRYGSDVDAAKSDYYASKGIKWVPADVHFRANGAIAKQPATAASPMFNTGKSVGRKPGYRGTV